MSARHRIILGGYQGPGSVHTRGLDRLGAALERLSGGEIAVEIRANVGAQGHKTADLPALVAAGEIDLCYLASSYLAARVPALALFDMPFAAPSRDRALGLLDGPLGARLAEDVAAATGMALLGVWDNGLRHMATADRALRRPADAAGLVLRTLPNEDHQRVFRSLGFRPRVVDATELQAAVAGGTVDAQENPLTNTLNFDLHRALPCITRTGHLMGLALLLGNRARIAALPAGLRRALQQAVAEATAAQRTEARAEDAACEARLAEAGARFCDLTETERAGWRRAAAPENARIRARLAPAVLALFDSPIRPQGDAPA